MKNKFVLIFTFCLFISCEFVSAQDPPWSPIVRITESKTIDKHVALSDKKYTWESSKANEFMVFERTDSNGTNICAANLRNISSPAKPIYLTKGDGLNGYPSTTTDMIFFHKIKNKYSNIYYSKYSNSGFSEPMPLTNDSNKFNLYPKCFSLMPFIEEYAVVWERENKIYFKKYDGKNWTREIKISPEDTFSYYSPVISYMDRGYNIAYQKYINSQRQDIICSWVDSNVYANVYAYVDICSIAVDGFNQNPRFINGFGRHLTWEKKENNKWAIYENYDILSINPRIKNRVLLSDSLYDYNNFIGMNTDLPFFKFSKDVGNINFNNVYIYIMACVYNVTRDGFKNLVLKSEGNEYILPNTNANNHALTQFRAGNSQKVWVIWESDSGGYINLYGSSYDIHPNKVGEIYSTREFKLSQNYPNPFNPTTTINYELPQPTRVSIFIYDILGRIVTRLVDENKQAGNYKVEWNARNLPSGIYYYRITAGDYGQVRKMLLLK